MARTNISRKRIVWLGFGISNLVLAIAPGILPMWLQLLFLGFSFLALFGLLWLFKRAVGSWRAILFAWAAYAVLRVLSVRLVASDVPFLNTNLETLAAVLSTEAMFTGLAAIACLAVRRDVSVAYVVLAYGLGSWLMLWMVRSSGGVLAFLTDRLSWDVARQFSMSEPLVISLSCMVTLGFLTFIPHFVYMLYRELRGR